MGNMDVAQWLGIPAIFIVGIFLIWVVYSLISTSTYTQVKQRKRIVKLEPIERSKPSENRNKPCSLFPKDWETDHARGYCPICGIELTEDSLHLPCRCNGCGKQLRLSAMTGKRYGRCKTAKTEVHWFC